MTIAEWKKRSVTYLLSSSTPLLDLEVLLCDALNTDKSWLLAHPEHELNDDLITLLDTQVKDRSFGKPLAYVRGKSEFYGRNFYVNEHVLVPRPESEAMIELLVEREIQEARGDLVQVVDVGTGSGALGITAALELQKLAPNTQSIQPVLIDIDPNCLKVARRNAKTYHIKIKTIEGDLLLPFVLRLTSYVSHLIILANLPYVPDSYQINNAAEHEPKLALFGGQDGLELFRNLFLQLERLMSHVSRLTLYTESLPLQHEALRGIAEEHEFKQMAEKDFIQVFELSNPNHR